MPDFIGSKEGASPCLAYVFRIASKLRVKASNTGLPKGLAIGQEGKKSRNDHQPDKLVDLEAEPPPVSLLLL